MSGTMQSLLRYTKASAGDAVNDHDAIASVRPVDVYATVQLVGALEDQCEKLEAETEQLRERVAELEAEVERLQSLVRGRLENVINEYLVDSGQRNVRVAYKTFIDHACELCDLRDKVADLEAEVERSQTWAGLMATLDRYYPADLVTGESGDPGPRIVVLVRAVDRLHAAIRQLYLTAIPGIDGNSIVVTSDLVAAWEMIPNRGADT